MMSDAAGRSTDSVRDLLKDMKSRGASDLHLSVGAPPMFRVNGRLIPTPGKNLTPRQTMDLAYGLMNEDQRKRFEKCREVDFSFNLEGFGRFRANVFVQSGSTSCAIRLIPQELRALSELGLPPVVEHLIHKPNGLILVTGPTGSGKSTTLAAMVDGINRVREGHVITIEDPIEYIHVRKKCIISQREVHQDTESFASALRVSLRQDPDAVMIGEMRDLETIQTALTVAETGHLTLTTLHTNSAARTINRIIDVFPAEQKSVIRVQLSLVLEGIISQVLLPKLNAAGMVLACEVLVATPAVRAMIRENKVYQIPGIMELSQQRTGMQTLNDSLAGLVNGKLVRREDALQQSPDPEQLRKLFK
jgi:twitching motility protein PilT